MKIKEKIKTFIRWFLTIIGTIFFGVTAIFYIKENKTHDIADVKKKDKENELKKKTADDIAADSPNSDIISANIKKEQDKFHDRVSDRLKGKL